jgi:serine phosphatase RsbU (regulator of sigma subunit)/PAS domain-containing protein
MSTPTRGRVTAAVGPGLWRPNRNREFALGLALALVLPWVAVWLTDDPDVFDRFPGLPFLAATVVVTLVGRLGAGLVAVIASGLLITYFEVEPIGGISAADAGDLIAVVVFVALSFIIAYALSSKDASRDEAQRSRSDVERLALALAAERNLMDQIMQQMPNGVLVVDAGGTVAMQNPRSKALLGYEYTLGQPIGPPDTAPWTARRPDGTVYEPADYPLTRSLRQGQVVIGERMSIERADGTEVMIEVDTSPIREGAAVTGGVAVFQDVTARVQIQQRLERTTQRLEQIQAVTDAALASLSFDELADRLLHTVRRVLQTDSATLLLVDRTGTSLQEHMTVGVETDGPNIPIPIGRGIAGSIAASVAPVVIDDLATKEAVRHWLTDRMRSFMGVPLVYRGEVRGVIHVATIEQRHFSEDEVGVLELAAIRIAAALERASLYDSRSAMSQALQRSLLPATLPTIEGVEIAAFYRPFSPNDDVGGDFYDLFPHGSGAWGVVVGDVSGKGPDAAAVMGIAAHTVRALARYEERPSAVLGALNDILLRAEGVSTERFCTACEMRLRPGPGQLRVTVCLAGHPMPFVVRADGQVEQLGEPGTLLGTFADPELHDVAIDLWPGDAIVAYTDGLVERRDLGIDVGEVRLAELLSGCAGFSADGIVERIEQHLVQELMPDDDVAIVVVRQR